MPHRHRSRARRVRRWLLAGAASVVGVACAASLGAVGLARARPAWWRPDGSAGPGVDTIARRIEDSVASSLTLARPADPAFVDAHAGAWGSEVWTLRVGAPEANAWLNRRLRGWLRSQELDATWPPELRELQVDFSGSRIRVGARLHGAARDRVLSATLAPAIGPDGSLWVDAGWVHVGRLGMPASWVIDDERAMARYVPARLRERPESAGIARALAGAAPLVREAVFRLPDGRRVRVLGIEARDGVLELTCRTEAG